MDTKLNINNTINNQDKKQKTILKDVLEWVLAIGVAFLIAYFITHVLIINTVVPSESMQPTINVNDRLITNRLAYLFKEPERGDVIVLPSPDEEGVLFVKRIIGLPNETVDIIDGEVYIDGVKLEEDYVSSPITDKTRNSSYQVPEDCVFVMGDNRAVSVDARYWHDKYLKIDDIEGKVAFRYFPGIKIIS